MDHSAEPGCPGLDLHLPAQAAYSAFELGQAAIKFGVGSKLANITYRLEIALNSEPIGRTGR